MENPQLDFADIAALDLDPIKTKLMHQESGEGWTLAQANAIEIEYRRFLYLMKKFPNELAAPRFDVDIFWHYHILDTKKYAQDCDAIFGYFLHHFPYLGLRGEEDLEAHHRIGERTRELYEETFGEPYVLAAAPGEGATMATIPGVTGSAFSVRDPGMDTQTAFSVRAPSSLMGGQTAFSVRAPGTVMDAQTAFSVRTPSSVMASQTAFSVRAPVSVANAQTAFSVRAPVALGAGDTAFSVRTPASAISETSTAATEDMSPELDDEQVRKLTAFFAVRPGIATPAFQQ
jgi:hypothetical protein